VALASLALLLITTIGCSDAQKRRWTHRTPAQNLSDAREAENPDQRREAVTRIAESGYFARDDAFAVLDTVVRTDDVTQIRCIAIRALGRYEDPRPVGTLLFVLNTEQASLDAQETDANVRWETTAALRALAERDALEPAQQDLVRDVFIRLLEADPSRNVRIEAVKGLAHFKDRAVLIPLIRTLRSNDFALADQAERSLIALTGTTHAYDAEAWEQWVATTADPFEHAGRQPDVPTRRRPSWWENQERAFRRAIRLNTE
jgi:HEAT repeat protein